MRVKRQKLLQVGAKIVRRTLSTIDIDFQKDPLIMDIAYFVNMVFNILNMSLQQFIAMRYKENILVNMLGNAQFVEQNF